MTAALGYAAMRLPRQRLGATAVARVAGGSLFGGRSAPACKCRREVCREATVPLALPDAKGLAPLEASGERCTRKAEHEDVPSPPGLKCDSHPAVAAASLSACRLATGQSQQSL
jgi:hypothetical protein